jgi:tetratricopeptide (TPR) repeat protein
MNGCFEHILEAVHRYEGTINQFTGDGVMALFGAPIAHEDHAIRAASAALAVQAALRSYAERLRRERGIEFAMRIGLNTGEVVVGRIGDDLRMDYTAQGETVNLAARLQSAAPPGGILMSEATHRLVSRYFVTQPVGVLQLKGIVEEVVAFAVTGQRTRQARFSVALERGLSPLVGRDRELRFLRECLSRLREGRGRVVSVVGDAGVGKSRLLHELQRELRDTDLGYREAQCLPHGESQPFHLALQVLQAEFRIEEGEEEGKQAEKIETGVRALDPSLAWVIQPLQYLFGLSVDDSALAGLDPTQRKQRLVDAVRVFAIRGTEVRPLVLFVEDLQWIDPQSEDVVATLVDAVAEHPMLILCGHRPGYVPRWQNRSTHDRLAIDPLSEEETRTMARALLGTNPRAADLVVRRAEGNPLFVEELAAYFRDHPATVDEGIPGTIRDLLAARIDRLAEGVKETLQIAAVLGREFPLTLLEAVSPPGRDIRSDLAALVGLELLHETDLFPEVRYRFALRLTQEVAYQGLLQRSRAEIHQKAGGALERLFAERINDALPELVRHFSRSPDRARAVRYLTAAGDRALSLFAFAEARGHYQNALERLDSDSAERCALLERLGDAAFAEGLLREALEWWAKAVEAGGVAMDASRTAGLHRKMAVATWAAGDKQHALLLLEEALAGLEGNGPPPARCVRSSRRRARPCGPPSRPRGPRCRRRCCSPRGARRRGPPSTCRCARRARSRPGRRGSSPRASCGRARRACPTTRARSR